MFKVRKNFSYKRLSSFISLELSAVCCNFAEIIKSSFMCELQSQIYSLYHLIQTKPLPTVPRHPMRLCVMAVLQVKIETENSSPV